MQRLSIFTQDFCTEPLIEYNKGKLFQWLFSDRKKDLVKLSNGEYVSLGKIESVIKTCVYIENACVCADSSRDFSVALIVPAQAQVLRKA